MLYINKFAISIIKIENKLLNLLAKAFANKFSNLFSIFIMNVYTLLIKILFH